MALPDCTAVATRAATPARATAAARRCVVRGVRLWEDLLLNTDSFCAAADHAARGDRSAGGPAGRYEAVRRDTCCRAGAAAAARRWTGAVGLL
ncbi:hypothetical protein GCM10010398_51450 [Streptomyces fimbriatus]